MTDKMHRVVVTPLPVRSELAIKYGFLDVTDRTAAHDLSEIFAIVDRDSVVSWGRGRCPF
jgi:hypothetical protein